MENIEADNRKKAEEILQKHIDKESMDEISGNIWPDIIEAMLDYHAQQLAEIMPDIEEVKKTAVSLYGNWSHQAYAIEGFKDAIVWLRSRLLKNKSSVTGDYSFETGV